MILAERAARMAERTARVEAEAVAARAQAVNSSTEALIVHLKLEIEKLRRQLYGSRSEHKARLLEQMELHLQAAFAQAVPRSSAARAHCHRRASKLSLLRIGETVEAR